jgi:type II secretory pathway component PulM
VDDLSGAKATATLQQTQGTQAVANPQRAFSVRRYLPRLKPSPHSSLVWIQKALSSPTCQWDQKNKAVALSADKKSPQ